MPQKGEIIAGRIELISSIGGGAQGTVWAAIDHTERIKNEVGDRYNYIHPNLKTTAGGPIFTNNVIYQFVAKEWETSKPNCAVKFLTIPSTKAVNRFKEEYKAVSMLDDPGIIQVKDYDIPQDREHDGLPWILMDIVIGGTLEDFVNGNDPPSVLDSLTIFKTIANSVNAAHINKPSIIHRDLKPANILMRDRETPVVSDFGICLIIDEKRVSITSSDEIVGARHYIAPELEGSITEDPSPASDIYSLGKILYYMLSGGNHLSREDYNDRRYELRNLEGMPEQLEYIYRMIFPKTICKKRSDRFQSISDLLSYIDHIEILITEHFYPVKRMRKCIICGEGYYTGEPNSNVRDAEWRLTCSKCGNIQLFVKNPEEEM